MYEINKGISVENEDGFDIDDEVITEEEFLKNVDEELDRRSKVIVDTMNVDSEQDSHDDEIMIDIYDQLSDNEDTNTEGKSAQDESRTIYKIQLKILIYYFVHLKKSQAPLQKVQTRK